MEHCQHHVEASWVSLWPQINQAYHALGSQHLSTAKHIFHDLATRLAQQQDFPAHRYSVDIGLGLVALEQREFAQAQEMSHAVLKHRQALNIETYVLAETGWQISRDNKDIMTRHTNAIGICSYSVGNEVSYTYTAQQPSHSHNFYKKYIRRKGLLIFSKTFCKTLPRLDMLTFISSVVHC